MFISELIKILNELYSINGDAVILVDAEDSVIGSISPVYEEDGEGKPSESVDYFLMETE